MPSAAEASLFKAIRWHSVQTARVVHRRRFLVCDLPLSSRENLMKHNAIAFLSLLFAAAPASAQHAVNLTWTASTDAADNPSLAYNIYRASTCGGTFTKLNASPLAATAYFDAAVLPGSHCYQITSVLNGTEGDPSNQAAALIPTAFLPQQTGCQHRGSLLSWRRCASAIAHAQPKAGKPQH